MKGPIRVGVIGCGKISAAYFSGLKPYGIVDVVACADLVEDRASEKAEEFEILSRAGCDGCFDESSISGTQIAMQTTCERPAPLPMGLMLGELHDR